MPVSPDTETIENVIFELRPHHRVPTESGHICLRKNRQFVNRYLDLAREFSGCRMVEVGVDRGGSTAFFTKLLNPQKLAAIELSAEPVQFIENFLSTHDLEGRVSIHWGVDQSDKVAVSNVLDQNFSSEKIDLVVDDASHLLAPSIATFEMLFPRLRPGGLYVLEDWSAIHLQERAVDNAVLNDVDGKQTERFLKAAEEGLQKESPMSVLICELVIAVGRNPDWVSEIRVADGFCEVRRGEAPIPPHTPIGDYIGSYGRWIFEQHTTSID